MAERLTLARPYAEAVFLLAQEDNDLSGWATLLKNLAMIARDERMKDIFGNPAIADDTVFALLSDIVGKLDKRPENFVRVLMENGRLALLPEISSLYDALRSEAEASVDVVVTSAMKMDSKQEASLVSMLEKKLGKKIQLTSMVDAALIGGIVIRAGDLVIDGSVKGRLGDLASQLTH
jgi:F-type H+-transporting ATPase subunit delta